MEARPGPRKIIGAWAQKNKIKIDSLGLDTALLHAISIMLRTSVVNPNVYAVLRRSLTLLAGHELAVVFSVRSNTFIDCRLVLSLKTQRRSRECSPSSHYHPKAHPE
jgi:hypothetical protein